MIRIKENRLFRFIICFLRIPYIYIFLRGHIAKKGRLSVDREGRCVPWFTYPAIDFLDNIDFSGRSVFEFGSGSSTFWWAERAEKVVSVEMDKKWYEYVKEILPGNASIYHCPDGGIYPGTINTFNESFDVILVDGAERFRSCSNAMRKLSPEGIIILDNSDWYPNAAKLLTDNGFIRIDFYGFSPNNSFPALTSLFFKDSSLLRRRKSAAKKVIGGRLIKGGALDDK